MFSSAGLAGMVVLRRALDSGPVSLNDRGLRPGVRGLEAEGLAGMTLRADREVVMVGLLS